MFAHEGRALAWFCAGSGSPMLILEAPSGVSNEEAFKNVLPQLVQRGRVCAYERAFYGASDPLPEGQVQTLSDYAAELAAFLNSVATDEHYVLVGFSYGGWVARYHAGHSPQAVQGLVLIDSPHVDWLAGMKAQLTTEDWDKVQAIVDWFIDNRGHDVLASAEQMRRAPALAHELPIALVTRTQDHDRMRLSGISGAGFRIYNDLHFQLSPELEALSDNTLSFFAPEGDHMIPDNDPDLVLQAVDAILDAIETD